MTRQLYDENPYLQSCKAMVTKAGEDFICFDQTVFYPLGGGQVGDIGTVIIDGENIEIRDTTKGPDGNIQHKVSIPIGSKIEGQYANLSIDWSRRYSVMKFHTALHVLLSLLDYPVTGAKVGHDKGHLDFDLDGNSIDKEDLTDRLNESISAGHVVATHLVPEGDIHNDPKYAGMLTSKGAPPPIFGGMVRFVQVGADNAVIDLQPCGGTHVKDTSEIGRLKVLKIKSRGTRNRRVTIGFDQ